MAHPRGGADGDPPGGLERYDGRPGARAPAPARRGGAWIVATSAVREASNGRDFARHVSDLAGHPVRVVPGDAEARLALRGVMHALRGAAGGEPSQKNPEKNPSGSAEPGQDVLVFDIGGGSTEFIRARDGVLQAAVSLRLGVVPLVEQFRDYEDIARHVRARLEAEVPPGIARPTPDLLVGTAGTVTTVAALDLGLERYDGRPGARAPAPARRGGA